MQAVLLNIKAARDQIVNNIKKYFFYVQIIDLRYINNNF